MNRLDRVIAYFAPGRAARRALAREVIEGRHKAAQPSRLNSLIRENRDPNSIVWSDAVQLRERARQLEQNSDIARHALDILVDKTIGTGLTPEPMGKLEDGSPATDFNQRITELYQEWAERPEASWHHDALSAQRLTARSLFRDGDVFLQHLVGNVPNLRHFGRVPYSFELLEADMVPHEMNQAGIVQGIAVNTWKQEQAYFVYKEHPNSTNVFYVRTASVDANAFTRIPAERMEHLALLDRIGQIRGISLFASVILRLGDIDEIDESERVAARVAAAMCAAIIKGTPDDYTTGASSPGSPRELKWRPGMIFDDLLPGESVQSLASNRPNNGVIDFRDANVRAAAGGIGVGFSNLANKYEGTYSSQRQELVEQDIHYKVLSAYFINRMERPKYRRFIQAAVLAGLVPEWRDIDRNTIDQAHWSAPVMPWVDPQKEMTAIEKALDIGVTSRPRVQRERGLSPREIALEREADQTLTAELDAATAPEGRPGAASTEADTDNLNDTDTEGSEIDAANVVSVR